MTHLRKCMKTLLLAFALQLAVMVAAPAVMPAVTAEAATSKPWKPAYRSIIDNWRSIENYVDTDYLKMYFGKDYKFNRYFLCDIDRNGTPELLLFSTTMQLTMVFTYGKNGLVFIDYDAYDRINRKSKCIVARGHWHGAGGSGVDEYQIVKIKGTKGKYMYIDVLNGVYSVLKGDQYVNSAKTYNSRYKKYVKGSKMLSRYKKYKLKNKKGLNKIQK